MKAIFSALHKELSAGKSGVLCSIIASEGSTPRGSGAKMLVMADGSTAGTIGGGAVEYRCTALAKELCREKRSQFQSYRLSAGDIADIGMICGGNVELFLQYLDPADSGLLSLVEQALPLVDSFRELLLRKQQEQARYRKLCGLPHGDSKRNLANFKYDKDYNNRWCSSGGKMRSKSKAHVPGC